MGLRLKWSNTGGPRVTDSIRIGPFRIWASKPLAKTKNGRKRKARWGVSTRL
jgi:hypothetical protein